MTATVRDLLAQAPAAHRRSVADTLGLARHDADELAATLLDGERLAAICNALGPAARSAAAHLVVGGGAIALARYGPKVDPGPVRELERHGIAFAFEETWQRAYHVPDDLRRPLAAALAARHAGAVGNRGAKRWLAAPRQHLHDAAAISAFCARTPIRVKADGQIYARMWPKLVAVLPPLELDLGDAHERVAGALALLRDGGFLRLSIDDRPGVEARRELVPAGDLSGWLGADDGELDARLPDSALLAATVGLTDALAGRDVLLTGFGAALRALLIEARVHVPGSWTTRALAESGLGARWRMGALQLGVDGGGKLVAARIAPVAAPASAGPPAICQSNFEIVALRPPTPGERLVLELCCEAVAGQAHVWKLTRAAARCGQRSGLRGGVLAALAGVCREALPQNVARTLEGWVRDVRAPLRLRSAIVVDAGDVDSAERLLDGPLAGLVVERLGQTLLAVSAAGLRKVEHALAAAGEELEPGLDRVSGRWLETPSRSHEAAAAWSSRGDEDREPAGRLTSTLRAEQPVSDAISPVGSGALLSSDPIVAVLAALERGGDVFVVYAGARGISERVITPLEVDAARVRAFCHLRGDERSFWLSSIQLATPVG